MERRKKGSGRITYVEDRKSPWRATVTDGRGKQKTRFFKTEKEAKAFLRDINADASKLKALTESGVTFAAFSQIFLDEKKKGNMKVLAYKALEDQVKRVCTFVGTAKLSDIDSDMVQQMVFALAEQGYSESVMTKAKIAAFSTYVPKKYTKYAGQTLMVHPAGYKLLFILHTGLRLGEALALTWSDYDEYSKTVMIDKNTVYADGEKITQMPKTESGERLIILNRQAVQDLECLRRQFDEQSREIEQRKAEELRQAELKYFGPEQKSAKLKIKEKYAAIEREHKYICGSSTFPYGSGGHSSTLQTHKKICKVIGLSHTVTVHGLRHTYVTHYYLHHKNDPDFDLATFSKSIGHSSIRTTMEIYAHLDMTQNRYIPRAMEDLKEF